MLRLAALLFLLAATAFANCPSGSIYDKNFNTCYKFVSTPKSFLDAEQYCNSLGGHLADEANAFESTYIAGISSGASSQESNFWIGANLLRSSNWKWTSDTPMGYTNWGSGQPNNANPCAYVKNPDATWETLPCNSLLPFMCKISPNATQPGTCPTQTPLPTSPSQPSHPTCAPDTCPYDSYCTDGYTLYTRNCLCYKYYNDKNLTFSDATDFCVNKGGMLAKVPSADVNYFLTVLPGFQTWEQTEPWIGLSCSSSFQCTWVDGTPLGNYTNFRGRGPYVYTLISAIRQRNILDGMWDQWQSDYKAAQLCQKPSINANLQMNSAKESGEAAVDAWMVLPREKKTAF